MYILSTLTVKKYNQNDYQLKQYININILQKNITNLKTVKVAIFV